MSAARKNTKKPGQRTSGWRQSRCSLDSHYVTNHTLTVRDGVITQSRAKSPGAPQTSTLSLCLIEQFNVMLGTVRRHSIRYHVLSSTFSLSSARRFPNGLTHRTEGTPNSHFLFWMKWPGAGGRLEPKWLEPKWTEDAKRHKYISDEPNVSDTICFIHVFYFHRQLCLKSLTGGQAKNIKKSKTIKKSINRLFFLSAPNISYWIKSHWSEIRDKSVHPSSNAQPGSANEIPTDPKDRWTRSCYGWRSIRAPRARSLLGSDRRHCGRRRGSTGTTWRERNRVRSVTMHGDCSQ